MTITIIEPRTCKACRSAGPCELSRLEFKVAGGIPETRYHIWWRCQGCGENAMGGGRWVGSIAVREGYGVAPADLPIRERGMGVMQMALGELS